MTEKSKTGKGSKITLRIVVSRPAALKEHDVADYVAQAIDGWSGSFSGDDPRREIAVVRMYRRGWLMVKG